MRPASASVEGVLCVLSAPRDRTEGALCTMEPSHPVRVTVDAKEEASAVTPVVQLLCEEITSLLCWAINPTPRRM